jgi:hypothetical protein
MQVIVWMFSFMDRKRSFTKFKKSIPMFAYYPKQSY